ncbi:MAG: chemotaxis protein CheA, partial [Bacteriovoracaceae bacterium]
MFRLAHNIKGSSAAVGFAELADFTHHVESFLLKIKDGEIPVESAVVDLLLQINDCLKQSVEGLKKDLNFQFDYQEVVKGIEALIQGQPASTDKKDEKNEKNNDALVFENMESLEVSEKPAAETTVVEKPVAEPVADKKSTQADPAPADKPSSTSEENIRVGLARVDQLINIVGEMVILDTVLSKQHEQIDADGELKKTFSQMQKIIRELQDISMSFRMLPIKGSFKKMQRIVRDTSKALDKKINLHISGEDTEVDKSLLEKMADPLVHIVRNAADHGLESSEKRLEAGKSVEGNLWLSAYHKGNFTVIEVKDDGAGIDPEVIRKKAVEKGLISADQILTDEESIELIFAPGFSTKEQVTEVSGRGVGMDVVKTNIKELRGEIKISSKMGEGSVFKIYLPLTLAIVDGMVVHAGEHRFVVPISQITESVHATQIHSIGGRKEVLSLRGKSMALYRLSSLLGYSSNDEISDQGIA